MYTNGDGKKAIRVNGCLLGESGDKEVILLAYVLKVHPNSKTLEVKTTDDLCVTVTMLQPLSELLDGLVEFHGTSQGSKGILCSSYTNFSEKMAANFNTKDYNTALLLMNTIPNSWTGTY